MEDYAAWVPFEKFRIETTYRYEPTILDTTAPRFYNANGLAYCGNTNSIESKLFIRADGLFLVETAYSLGDRMIRNISWKVGSIKRDAGIALMDSLVATIRGAHSETIAEKEVPHRLRSEERASRS